MANSTASFLINQDLNSIIKSNYNNSTDRVKQNFIQKINKSNNTFTRVASKIVNAKNIFINKLSNLWEKNLTEIVGKDNKPGFIVQAENEKKAFKEKFLIKIHDNTQQTSNNLLISLMKFQKKEIINEAKQSIRDVYVDNLKFLVNINNKYDKTIILIKKEIKKFETELEELENLKKQPPLGNKEAKKLSIKISKVKKQISNYKDKLKTISNIKKGEIIAQGANFISNITIKAPIEILHFAIKSITSIITKTVQFCFKIPNVFVFLSEDKFKKQMDQIIANAKIIARKENQINPENQEKTDTKSSLLEKEKKLSILSKFFNYSLIKLKTFGNFSFSKLVFSTIKNTPIFRDVIKPFKEFKEVREKYLEAKKTLEKAILLDVKIDTQGNKKARNAILSDVKSNNQEKINIENAKILKKHIDLVADFHEKQQLFFRQSILDIINKIILKFHKSLIESISKFKNLFVKNLTVVISTWIAKKRINRETNTMISDSNIKEFKSSIFDKFKAYEDKYKDNEIKIKKSINKMITNIQNTDKFKRHKFTAKSLSFVDLDLEKAYDNKGYKEIIEKLKNQKNATTEQIYEVYKSEYQNKSKNQSNINELRENFNIKVDNILKESIKHRNEIANQFIDLSKKKLISINIDAKSIKDLASIAITNVLIKNKGYGLSL